MDYPIENSMWRSPGYEGVNLGGPNERWILPEHLQARDGQATQADILLALNRMMGLAPADSRYTGGGSRVVPVIPSEQARKEARVIMQNSGALNMTDRQQQLDALQAMFNMTTQQR